MTYTPDPSSLVEVMVGVESTYGTYATPTVQIATASAPTFGLGHQIIQGSHLTSTIQKVITHAAIRGIDTPFISFPAPLSANSLPTLMHMLSGSVLAGNVWAIEGNPAGFTVGVNVQRPGSSGGDYFAFTGLRVGAATFTMPLGDMPTLSLDCVATDLEYPDTVGRAIPNLAPATSNRPFILTDVQLKHATSTGGLAGATPVKIRGFTMSVDLGLHIEHNSSKSSPDHVVRTAYDVTGTIEGHFGEDWWDEWKAVVAGDLGGATGYVTHYLEFTIDDGTNTLSITIPAKLDMADVSPDDRALNGTLSFIGAGDTTTGAGGAPTVAAMLLEDA